MDELLVECVYSEEGCKYQGQRQLLAAHLKDECALSDSGKLRGAHSKGKSVDGRQKDSEDKTTESGAGANTSQRVRLFFRVLFANSHRPVVKIPSL